MKFKALLSPKQFLSYKGQVLRASEGILYTEDKEVIAILLKNTNWQSDENIEEPEIDNVVETVNVDDKVITDKQKIKRGKK